MGSKGQDVGYIRVSSYDQNTERQLEGVQLDKVFTEKVSAKDVKRPQLQACLGHLREGDTLHVHSIDRLARNLKDLQTIVEEVNAKKVTVWFHKENLRFTGEQDPMQRLMMQLIGAVAEFERSLIKERQREGIANAKKRGDVRFGAKAKLTVEQVAEIRKRVERGEQKADLATEYGISRQTLYASLKRAER